MRLLGALFVLLGGLPALFVHYSRGWTGGIWLQLLMAADAVVLIGPGVWFLFGAVYARRRQTWAVVISQRVASGQFAALVLTAVIGLLLGGPGKMVLLPGFLAAFFVPALGAMMWQLSKAKRAIALLDAPGAAFQPVHVHRAESDQPSHGGGDAPST
jgi:hypothetical protein